jgi:septum formation protein
MTIILASTSPRRLELLKQIGVTPDTIIVPACDETPLKNELPAQLAARLALLKAQTVHAQHQNALVIAGDTVVACGRRILPKCVDAAEVIKTLTLLSGRRHRVYGGLTVIGANGVIKSRLVQSVVAFKALHADEIAAYANTGEGIGKAGGYAYQGRAAALIRFISGSASNIIGLPLYETAQLLRFFKCL